MTILKNKILIKPIKKLIFIISILMIVALNLIGEEKIEFKYYYYTNKIYHSTLKTEIIPSEYVFITTTSSNRRGEYYDSYWGRSYRYYYDKYSYIYNLKTKEKKLLYVINFSNDVQDGYEYYDINGNLTTNWTDTNMGANGFYEITNNRFGETLYYGKDMEIESCSLGDKYNEYIQKAYKYSLTQPEIINKKDRGIYMFRKHINSNLYDYFSLLCLQNEYYYYDYNDISGFREDGLLNYDSKGRVIFNRPMHGLQFSYMFYNSIFKRWSTVDDRSYNEYTNTIYFKLNDKSLIKPTWNEFNNNFLDFMKLKRYYMDGTNFHYSKKNTENNLNEYKKSIDVDFLCFIPIEEFEYYLLAD